MKIVLSTFAGIIVALMTSPVKAQQIAWDPPVTYANGYSPAVGMNMLGLGWMAEEHAAGRPGPMAILRSGMAPPCGRRSRHQAVDRDLQPPRR